MFNNDNLPLATTVQTYFRNSIKCKYEMKEFLICHLKQLTWKFAISGTYI